MSEDSAKNSKAPAKQQSKSESPGPRNRNRNKNSRSKSPKPGGQGKARPKSPGPRNNSNNRKGRSPTRGPKKTESQSSVNAVEKAPPSPYLLVDGLFVHLSNTDYKNAASSTSMQMLLTTANVATKMVTVKSSSSTASSIVIDASNTNGLEKHLTPAFWCDPALTCIVAQAKLKSTEFIATSIPQSGPGPTVATTTTTVVTNNNKPKELKKSPAPTGNNKEDSRARCPGPRQKNSGRSKSPRPRQKQGKSKSPGRPKNSNSANNTAPAKPTNGKKSVVGTTTRATILPLHVQLDPFMVGMVTLTMDKIVSQKTASIDTEDRVNVLSQPTKTVKIQQPIGAVVSTTTALSFASYLEVEPLISQMVPDDIAEAINLGLSKRLDEDEELVKVVEEEALETPATQHKTDSDAAEMEEPSKTPSKDFKGRVAFFEKLTKQKTEKKTPQVDRTKKVKAEVSEKVRSAHDQVRTSLGGGNKAKNLVIKSPAADLPKDMTPLAEKRERVDKFFDKGEENAAKIPAATKPTQNSNWAKVETAPPVEFEGGDSEEVPEQETKVPKEGAPKVDKLVDAMEKDVSDKSKNTNGAKPQNKNGRAKSPKRNNRGRSNSPKRNQGKSKSPVRPKKVNSNNADETKSAPATVEEKTAVPAAEETEKTATPEDAKDLAAAAKAEKAPSPAPAGVKAEEKSMPSTLSTVSMEEDEASPATPAESKAQAPPTKAAEKGRAKSPRRKKGKSKSPVRVKKMEEATVASVAAPDVQPPPAVRKKTPPTDAVPANPQVEPAPVEDKALTTKVAKEEAKGQNAEPSKDATAKTSDTTGSEFLQQEKPAAENGVESSVSKEEAHGELLSRDIATEVLVDSSDVDDKAAAGDEFPSLGAAPKQLAQSEQWKKASFAKILSEGKKKEQAKSETPGSRFLIPELTLAGINIEEIENDLKDAARKEEKSMVGADNVSHASGKKGDAERVKMEEMAQRLAKGTPQKKPPQTIETGPVEETKEDGSADPGYTQIKREVKKNKAATEDETELVPPSELIPEPDLDGEEVVSKAKAFKKHNFNQFSVFDDELGDIPAEIVADTDPKIEKVRGLKNTVQPSSSPKRKKAGKDAKGKSKGAKNQSREILIEAEIPPPTVAIPLHWVNNLAHTKPFCYVFDGLFWTIALLLSAPLGAAGIVLLTLYKLLMFVPRLLGLGKVNPKSSPNQKLAVMITGCDSGFGKDLAFLLLEQGFVVFCGCLRKESMKAFEKDDLAFPILMDVTKNSDVDKASKEVLQWLSGEDDRVLHALVNNAGIGIPGLVDWLTVSEFKKMVDVNLLGMVRCTKKFLPRLKFQATEGMYSSARIVNMVSMAGLVSGGLYSVGYEASKHASEVFTANLRQEMKAFGLKVTVINPSFHKTGMTQELTSDLRRKWKSLPAAKRKEYGGEGTNL